MWKIADFLELPLRRQYFNFPVMQLIDIPGESQFHPPPLTLCIPSSDWADRLELAPEDLAVPSISSLGRVGLISRRTAEKFQTEQGATFAFFRHILASDQ